MYACIHVDLAARFFVCCLFPVYICMHVCMYIYRFSSVGGEGEAKIQEQRDGERERHREAEILRQLSPSVSISCDERHREAETDNKT
jgi:hypothetical protein